MACSLQEATSPANILIHICMYHIYNIYVYMIYVDMYK